MVARLLLWIVLGIAAWWMLRPRRRVEPPTRAARPPVAPGAPVEAMVECAACGLLVPASEALGDGAHRYCCGAHRDAGPRRAE